MATTSTLSLHAFSPTTAKREFTAGTHHSDAREENACKIFDGLWSTWR